MFQAILKSFSSICILMKHNLENIIWILLIFVLIVSALAIMTSIIFGANMLHGTYGPQYMMGGYPGYSMFFIMPVIGIISLIFFLLFIYFIIDGVHESESIGNARNPTIAEQIAKERYAKGEITEQEYIKIVDTLRK